MKTLDSNVIMQIGIVVRDIEAAAKRYAALFGVEPSPVRNVFPNITYRGRKVRPKAKICAFQMGSVTLELVEPDDTPTSWKEYLDNKGEGVHHLGVMVNDLDDAMNVLAENGISARQAGGAGWGSYTLVESEEQLGVVYNIKCNDPWPEND